jgi:hypothetical protein
VREKVTALYTNYEYWKISRSTNFTITSNQFSTNSSPVSTNFWPCFYYFIPLLPLLTNFQLTFDHVQPIVDKFLTDFDPHSSTLIILYHVWLNLTKIYHFWPSFTKFVIFQLIFDPFRPRLCLITFIYFQTQSTVFDQGRPFLTNFWLIFNYLSTIVNSFMNKFWHNFDKFSTICDNYRPILTICENYWPNLTIFNQLLTNF